jgi:hypothetical protein
MPRLPTMVSSFIVSFVSFIVVLFILITPTPVNAQVCYAARTINQFACIGSSTCSQTYYACAGNPSLTCGGPGDDGPCAAEYGGGGSSCDQFCSNWVADSGCQSTGSYSVSCNPSTCTANVTLTTCAGGVGPGNGNACFEDTDNLTYGCWGPGSSCGDGFCNGSETCSTCPSDCGGACSPTEVCGNGSCGSGETCGNCSADCGTCAPLCGNGSCDTNGISSSRRLAQAILRLDLAA